MNFEMTKEELFLTMQAWETEMTAYKGLLKQKWVQKIDKVDARKGHEQMITKYQNMIDRARKLLR